MKVITFILVTISNILVAQNTKTLLIEQGSSFRISGISNINEFDCNIQEGFCGESINLYYEWNDDTLIFDNAKFNLPLKNFDCKNRLITMDLKKTLKEDQFPFMHFQLLKTKNFNSENCSDSKAETLVTIAGETNRYYLNYNLAKLDADTYSISIVSIFDMNDFKITPPTALMGLIKVEEKINVSLDLIVRVIKP